MWNCRDSIETSTGAAQAEELPQHSFVNYSSGRSFFWFLKSSVCHMRTLDAVRHRSGWHDLRLVTNSKVTEMLTGNRSVSTSFETFMLLGDYLLSWWWYRPWQQFPWPRKLWVVFDPGASCTPPPPHVTWLGASPPVQAPPGGSLSFIIIVWHV